MRNRCKYSADFHRGKVEWHHPISNAPNIGIYLCEAHHSLLQGRRDKYLAELSSSKSLGEQRLEIQQLVVEVLKRAGYTEIDIDKA